MNKSALPNAQVGVRLVQRLKRQVQSVGVLQVGTSGTSSSRFIAASFQRTA